VSAAGRAMLLHFQSSFKSFFVLPGEIIHLFAFGALQLDHVIVGHRTFLKTAPHKVTGKARYLAFNYLDYL